MARIKAQRKIPGFGSGMGAGSHTPLAPSPSTTLMQKEMHVTITVQALAGLCLVLQDLSRHGVMAA